MRQKLGEIWGRPGDSQSHTTEGWAWGGWLPCRPVGRSPGAWRPPVRAAACPQLLLLLLDTGCRSPCSRNELLFAEIASVSAIWVGAPGWPSLGCTCTLFPGGEKLLSAPFCSCSGRQALLPAVTHGKRNSPNLGKRFRCWAAKKNDEYPLWTLWVYTTETKLVLQLTLTWFTAQSWNSRDQSGFVLGPRLFSPAWNGSNGPSCVPCHARMAPFLFGIQNVPRSNAHLLYFTSRLTANLSYVRNLFLDWVCDGWWTPKISSVSSWWDLQGNFSNIKK